MFLVGCPGCLIHNPFEEGLDLDVETGVGVLKRDDAVDSAVGEAGALVVAGEAFGFGVFRVFDVPCQSVGGADGVLAGDD